MDESDRPNERLWSFPEGMVGPEDSVKDFEVEASDGHAGKVSWASYAPGESYLVVSHRHHLRDEHHVVPAGAVETVDAERGTVRLRVTRAEIEQAPAHHDPRAPLDYSMVEALRSATSAWSLGGDVQ